MRSRLRAVSWALTTPLLADDYLKLINPLWSSRELRGRIVEVRPETRDSVTLAIKPGWGFRFDHQPGQYIGIGVLVDGRWRWRSYSLTSPASAGQRSLTITVKAMPEGFLSGHLVNGVRPGTVVRLAAPRGGFVMGNPAPEKVLFLTAGSGITPVMSMLRTMVRRNQIHDVEHLHSVPERADVMFAAELAAHRRPPSELPAQRARDESGRPPEPGPPRRCACPTGGCARPGPAVRPRCSTTPSGSGPQPGWPTGCIWSASPHRERPRSTAGGSAGHLRAQWPQHRPPMRRRH